MISTATPGPLAIEVRAGVLQGLGGMAGVDYIELSGGFQRLSGDEQVESSEIDNSLISSVNEQFATHRCNAAEWDEAPV